MAANDAFTAGVRPGGLTDSTEIRLLLCYLVKNAGPITRTRWWQSMWLGRWRSEKLVSKSA